MLLKLEQKHIEYPTGSSLSEKAAESAFEMKVRKATEEFEREIRGQAERPAEQTPRGPIG